MILNLLNKAGMNSVIKQVSNPLIKQLSWGKVGNILLDIGLKYLKSSSFTSSKYTNIEKIEEYQMKSATYLKDIPEVFGQMLLIGNIIWSTCISVKEYHEKMKSIKLDQYKKHAAYTASFAIAVCKGEVDEISKIYFNDEEINISFYNIEIYRGSKGQSPNSLIASHIGQNRTPAFRGLTYIVVKNLNLAEFNYKIPKVKCLVSKDVVNLSQNHSKLINLIAECIGSDFEIKPEMPIKGLMLSRDLKLTDLIRYLNLQIFLDESKIKLLSDTVVQLKYLTQKIDENSIVLIDGAKFIIKNVQNIYPNNFRISYLNAFDFKVKNYINSFDTKQNLYNIALPFAIDDKEIGKVYNNYKLKRLNSCCLYIIQVIASDIKLCVGGFIEVNLKTKITLRVIKRIYHTNNLITLFCMK